MAELIKFMTAGCPHCPLQDEQAIDKLLGLAEREKPDLFVHLGDGHEADSASRWPSEYDWSLKDEFEAHDALLKRIRLALPKKCRKVFLPGNHDANLLEIGRIDKRIRSQCDYRDPDNEPELAEHWEQPCEYAYDKRKGVFRVGQVSFAHGYECGVSSDEFQALLLGMPYGLNITAHTHRPMHVTRCYRTKAVPLPYWCANVGCLREMSPPYISRKRHHQWGQAAVVGEVVPLKSPRMSKHWSARVEIFRMQDDGDFD